MGRRTARGLLTALAATMALWLVPAPTFASQLELAQSSYSYDINAAAVEGVDQSYEYTGFAIRPSVLVFAYDSETQSWPLTLTEGIDYEVTYGENVETQGSVTVQGIGSYYGESTTYFAITPAKTYDVATANVEGVDGSYDYTGSAIRPHVTVYIYDSSYNQITLAEGTDYTVTYGENTTAGTEGTVTVSGIGSYYGTQTLRFSIVAWYADMYRVYNPNSGEHFYTASASERDHLSRLGWKYEGVAWQAPLTSYLPVYRLYNPNAGEHHYATSTYECDYLVGAGWKLEGIGWYADDNYATPVYRLYNPHAYANNHHYTVDLNESNWLRSLGWIYEGIGWYGL